MKDHESKKTIFISIPLGFAVRNILRTSVIQELRERYRVVIFSPSGETKAFTKQFEGPNTFFSKLHPYHAALVENVLTSFAIELFYSKNFVKTFETRKRTHPRSVVTKIIGLIAKVTPGKFHVIDFILHVLDRIYPDNVYSEVFKQLSPDLVFISHPYDQTQLPFIRQAKKRGVPIIGMILSWDNLTSHPLLPTRFDKVLVWNEFLREQLITYYGYGSNQIELTGIPQFDIYADPAKREKREEFFSKIGRDPSKRLITYTTSPIAISPYEHEIIHSLYQIISSGKLPWPCQLLVRFHPRDDQTRYGNLQGLDIAFDQPGTKSALYDDKWEPNETDMIHLASTLDYSDVIVNVASTITIDAAPFDTPVINIGYDGYHELPYLQSVLRYYYEYTHYIQIMKTGGFWVVKSPEELLKAISRYLENPRLHQEGRRRIVDEFCYRIDGKSGSRVAKAIIDFIEKSKRSTV